MSSVGLKGIDPAIQTKAREFIKNDGKLDTNEISELKKLATRNGKINKPDADYINSLSTDNQVQQVKISKTEVKQVDFPVDIKNSPGYNNLLNQGISKDQLEILLKPRKAGEKPILEMKDSQGKTVLESLNEMAGSQMKQGVDGKKLAQEAVALLAQRNNITQGPHGTCGAGSTQNYLWKNDPAELVRIVKDLSKDGKVQLRNNEVLTAPESAFNWHSGMKMRNDRDESRTDFDIIFQSTIMKSAVIMADSKNYDPTQDTGTGEDVSNGNSGIDPQRLQNVMQGITNQSFQTDYLDFDRLKEKVNKGEEVIACYFPTEGDANNGEQDAQRIYGMHYVTVNGFEKDAQGNSLVVFQNTQLGTEDRLPEDEFKKKFGLVISKNDDPNAKPVKVDSLNDLANKGKNAVEILTEMTDPRKSKGKTLKLIVNTGKAVVDEIKQIPAKVYKDVKQANTDTKTMGVFKNKDGKSITAKQSINTAQKETEERVLKKTNNKSAAKVAGKTAKVLQTVVATHTVAGITIANKANALGQSIQKTGGKLKQVSRLANKKADFYGGVARSPNQTTYTRVKNAVISDVFRKSAFVTNVVGSTIEVPGKAISYVAGGAKQAIGYAAQASKPVVDTVSNYVGYGYNYLFGNK